MTQPFIFVSTYPVKEGKWEDFRGYLQELVETVEANEPRLIAFNVYYDEENNKVSSIQVHPDAASMEFHLKVVAEHISAAYANYIDAPESFEFYGEAPKVLTDEATPPGTRVRAAPSHEAGFVRTSAAL